MIAFRGSAAGKCVAELVCSILHPERLETRPGWSTFLKLGHSIQDGVLEQLKEHSDHEFGPSELEGEISYSGSADGKIPPFKVVGHLDSIRALERAFRNVEIKALKTHTFKRLRRLTKNWKPLYPDYLAQANLYMLFPTLKERVFNGQMGVSPEVDTFYWKSPEGISATEFVFVCRETGEMIGGVPDVKDLPEYEYRESLIVPPSELQQRVIMNRYASAAQWVEKGEVPKCDREDNICYFCKQFGLKSEVALKVNSDSPKVVREPMHQFLQARDEWAYWEGKLRSASTKLADQMRKRKGDAFTYYPTDGGETEKVTYDDVREWDGRPE